MYIKVKIYCLLIALFVCCTNSPGVKKDNPIGYDLTVPDKTNILPFVLREISGLTIIDSSSVACIQDEKGIVFIFDLLRDQITKQIYFSPGGDYEGICRVDRMLFIQKSNGVLYKLNNYESSSFAEKINLPEISANDVEGLCYDQKNHRLLIAPKSKSGKGKEAKEKQLIFSYDLVSGEMDKVPAYDINMSDITTFMLENNFIHNKKGKKKNKKAEPEISLRPSEIAVHPITGKLYLLSSENHMLFVFDTSGRVEYIERLDPIILNMPEGLSFFKNGDMLISNESGNKYPTILRFNYKKK